MTINVVTATTTTTAGVRATAVTHDERRRFASRLRESGERAASRSSRLYRARRTRCGNFVHHARVGFGDILILFAHEIYGVV
jgi:hypothetical protein